MLLLLLLQCKWSAILKRDRSVDGIGDIMTASIKVIFYEG